jgi:hypothetical protein
VRRPLLLGFGNEGEHWTDRRRRVEQRLDELLEESTRLRAALEPLSGVDA